MATKAEIQNRKIRKAVVDALKETGRWKAYPNKFVRDDGLWIKAEEGRAQNRILVGSRDHRVAQLHIDIVQGNHNRPEESKDELTDLWFKMKFESPDCILPRPVLKLLKVTE